MSTLQAPSGAEARYTAKALLDRNELAKAVNVSLRTIDAWRSDGIIPFFKIGAVIRFDLNEVMAVLRERYQVRCQIGRKAL
jgi:excisionase family DNA binding protein